MISLREIADNNTSISSTRWAFAKVINFDIIIIAIAIVAFVICHIVDRPMNDSFFYAVGTLLGILTTLVATPKALQGFEPKGNKDKKINEVVKDAEKIVEKEKENFEETEQNDKNKDEETDIFNGK